MKVCGAEDFEAIWRVIEDGSRAYEGVIPADRWTEPYMPREKLRGEIEDGVEFWGIEKAGRLVAVMGVQAVLDVTLIRHAYVRRAEQGRGLGGELLRHLRTLSERPFLIGTWADAGWAIRFYERHGFQVVGHAEKERLLRLYWKVPARQIETSMVLADARWRGRAVADGSQADSSL